MAMTRLSRKGRKVARQELLGDLGSVIVLSEQRGVGDTFLATIRPRGASPR